MSEAIIYRAATLSNPDTLEYVLSDESVDRYGDIIMADGWDLRSFRKNPIALFNHNSGSIVGTWDNVRVENKRLVGRLRLAAQGTSRLVDEVRSLVAQGILKAVSVGFRAIKAEPLDKDDPDWGPQKYVKSELVECSVVAVPANANALQLSKALKEGAPLPAEIRRQLRGKVANAQSDANGSTPGKLASPNPDNKPRGSVMSIASQIKAAEAELNAMRDQLAALAENEDHDEDEAVLFEALPGEIDKTEKRVETLKRAEKALGLRAARNADDDDQPAPAARSAPGAPAVVDNRPLSVSRKKVEPVDFFVRAAVCQARAFMQQIPLERALQESYGNDEATKIILRAVTNPAMTTVTGWAAELVQQAVEGFIDTLKPASIYGPLSNRGSKFTFGRNGSIKIPGRSKTPSLAGSWIGEGAPKPVRKLGLTSITLLPYKLAVISTFTEEMAAYSTPQIEQVIRQAMADDTSTSLDTYLIDNVAASAIRPAGLLVGATAVTPDTTESDPLAMAADLKNLAAAIVANGGGRDIVYLMNPVQAMGISMAQATDGTFITVPESVTRTVISSQTVPVDTVIALDAADFATATGDMPKYSVSDQATIHEEDTTPLPITSGGGTPSFASPVRSLWQTDSIGVRMVLDVSWAMRRPGMVAVAAGVTW